jgi:hypothetical protein
MHKIFLVGNLVATLLFLSSWISAQSHESLPRTRAELTRYEETSRYDEVLGFFSELQKRSPLIRMETFGHAHEGRALPLVILSDPPISQPREARISGKPVVFIMANIHAGEVEGKEAAQHLSRRILFGDLRPLLHKLTILIAPIYNVDGNERFSLTNRMAQNGPIGGVGVRENTQGFDLNRDFIKLESPEARALVGVLNRWDPHMTVDLHTTDGSYHGYHLTYSVPLHQFANTTLINYQRNKMMPAIGKVMLAKHDFRTFYYGNFPRGASNTTAAAAEPREWRAFTHQPRVGQNYIGLRNRLTILSEAYSYLGFQRRIQVTEAFVEEILKYMATHGDEIGRLIRRADAETIQRGLSDKPFEFGVEYEPRAFPKPATLLIGEVTKVKNPRSGNEMTAMLEDKFTPRKMPYYGIFAATRSVPAARAYLFTTNDNLRIVTEKLLAHGITVEELTAPITNETQVFVINSATKSERRFQGHNEMKLTGQYQTDRMVFPEGTRVVRAAQPLGTLVVNLLEPESDDGLVTWNFLDGHLDSGKPYPIFKMMGNLSAPCRIVTEVKNN